MTRSCVDVQEEDPKVLAATVLLGSKGLAERNAFLMAAGCQKCFCVTFGESNKAFYYYRHLCQKREGDYDKTDDKRNGRERIHQS